MAQAVSGSEIGEMCTQLASMLYAVAGVLMQCASFILSAVSTLAQVVGEVIRDMPTP